jgi:hypothetical protein
LNHLISDVGDGARFGRDRTFWIYESTKSAIFDGIEGGYFYDAILADFDSGGFGVVIDGASVHSLPLELEVS